MTQCGIELEGLARALAVEGESAAAYEVLLGANTMRTSIDGVIDLPWWRTMIEHDVTIPAATDLTLVERFTAQTRATARGAEGAVGYGLRLSDPSRNSP